MPKLLLAHKDEKIIGMLRPELVKHFSLDSASDGLAAVRKLKLSAPQLIVADYDLPMVSGLGLLKFVRSHPQLYAVPFVFFSNHPQAHDALSSGASDWLSPQTTSTEELIDRIYYHLRLNRTPYGIQINRT